MATIYEGQLSPEELGEALAQERMGAEERRAAFLKEHPDYKPCSLAGCSGLVGPQWQRTLADGRVIALCPRRDAHSRLAPDLFPPRGQAAKNGTKS